MRSRLRPAFRRRCAGAVFIVVTWVILVLVALVLAFAREARVQMAASANHVAELQADSTAQAARQYVISQVTGSKGTLTTNTEKGYEAVKVGNGYFWLLKPDPDDSTTYAYGITGEAAKVNLNTADATMLAALPDATAQLAGGIVDWRDADDTVSANGVESEYYLLLSDPYRCKNANLETVDELLLIHGASQAIYVGEDTNRNGVLDPNENDGDTTPPSDNRDGILDRGLLPYATVYSSEPNTQSDGTARTNVNQDDAALLSLLTTKLGSSSRAARIVEKAASGRPFANVLDFYVKSGMTAEEFAKVADALTTSRETTLTGLVNVNTAPKQVLRCLPGLEESDVSQLLATRKASTTDLTNLAWVASTLTKEKAVAIGSVITTKSYQFSVDIVAASADGRAFRRYYAVVDASKSAARLLYWKDLTSLGWPLAPQVLTAMRKGTAPTASTTTVSGG